MHNYHVIYIYQGSNVNACMKVNNNFNIKKIKTVPSAKFSSKSLKRSNQIDQKAVNTKRREICIRRMENQLF